MPVAPPGGGGVKTYMGNARLKTFFSFGRLPLEDRFSNFGRVHLGLFVNFESHSVESPLFIRAPLTKWGLGGWGGEIDPGLNSELQTKMEILNLLNISFSSLLL